MKPIETIVHKGKSIVIVDISGCNTDEVALTISEASKKISALPPKSGLILTDVTATIYNQATSNYIKDFSSKNTPFVKASAVVGADGLREVLLKTVAMITKREIKPFDTRAEAFDWLVTR